MRTGSAVPAEQMLLIPVPTLTVSSKPMETDTICAPTLLTQVTQLGHVKDLARAFVMCLGNKAAANQIYNISGARSKAL